MSVNEKMTAIADTIRSFTGKPGKLGLDDMPGAINEAVAANGYDAGYSKGYEEGEEIGYQNGYKDGYDSGETAGWNDGYEVGNTDGKAEGKEEGIEEGIEEGKQAEYDRFWDAYLTKLYGLCYIFSGSGWNNKTFNLPIGTVLSSANCYSKTASQMFLGAWITDLKGICEERNITLDFSATTGFSQAFCDCKITAVPTIDTRSASNVGNMFWNANELVTVEKLILKNDGSQSCTNTFNGVPALQNIVIEGKFGKSVDVKTATKLTRASIESFVNSLSDTATGQTLTLSKTAVESAFGSTTAAEWTALVATKSNWTISLV